MSMVVHNFEKPDRFVAGTVGEPGQRTFFLQAKEGARVTSVALEKQQVAILAERMDLLLDEALRRSGGDAAIPAVAPVGLGDGNPLDQPIVEEFRVGTITLSWDADDGSVVIELFPVSEESVASESLDDDADETAESDAEIEVEASEVLVVKLDPGYARSFVRRANSVVSAGRPPCQFCGNPVDPDGHLCPRSNGFKRIAN
ncbi:MAG: DUF3090 domain-containing protein [Propionibacteriales bacterium]|nr:DUF3090 domain-containing protein [Propionibacteriales bacterium]